MTSHRLAHTAARVLLAVGLLAAGQRQVAALELPLGDGLGVELDSARALFLTTAPLTGEGYLGLADRLTGSIEPASLLKDLNGDPNLVAGKRYRVPVELARVELRRRALKVLLPEDSYAARSWRHVVARDSAVARSESLWSIASFFTGEGSRHGELADHNRLKSTALKPGDIVSIPDRLLRSAFRFEDAPAAATAVATLPSATPVGTRARHATEGREPLAVPEASSAELSFEEGPDGGVAIYRLKPGEAIYSDVIIRFTTSLHAEEVNALVPVIQRLSGITDARDVAVGYPIRIPRKLLAPEFLPTSDPQRVAYERSRRGSQRYRQETSAPELAGVYVVLDPGHGGRDLGAVSEAVWEHEYVYDIMCRIKAQLESETRATVIPLLLDRKTRYRVQERQRLSREEDETVLLTHPPYGLEETAIGVNMRWYLANSVFRELLKQGVDRRKIVFTSIHADSLHPDVRGAMTYVPGSAYTSGRHSRSGPAYARFREYRQEPSFEFDAREREEAEGLSRHFAERLLGAFGERGLAIHDQRPIRDAVLRQGRQWLPAVLRSNRIPTRVLLEVVNLNHLEDNRLLESPRFRQEVALAYVEALRAFYGAEPGPRVAAR